MGKSPWKVRVNVNVDARDVAYGLLWLAVALRWVD